MPCVCMSANMHGHHETPAAVLAMHLIADERERQRGTDSLDGEERKQAKVGLILPLILPDVQQEGSHLVGVQMKVANQGLDLQYLQHPARRLLSDLGKTGKQERRDCHSAKKDTLQHHALLTSLTGRRRGK